MKRTVCYGKPMRKPVEFSSLRMALANAPKRERGRTPRGQHATGLQAFVDEHLEELLALHEEGVTWPAIAAALTELGYRTSDDRPLSDRNLTGCISTARRKRRRAEERIRDRLQRTDLQASSVREGSRRLTLAPDLVRTPDTEAPPAADEAALRRKRLEGIQHLLRPRPTDKD